MHARTHTHRLMREDISNHRVICRRPLQRDAYESLRVYVPPFPHCFSVTTCTGTLLHQPAGARACSPALRCYRVRLQLSTTVRNAFFVERARGGGVCVMQVAQAFD